MHCMSSRSVLPGSGHNVQPVTANYSKTAVILSKLRLRGIARAAVPGSPGKSTYNSLSNL